MEVAIISSRNGSVPLHIGSRVIHRISGGIQPVRTGSVEPSHGILSANRLALLVTVNGFLHLI